jgi:hypothetical protein
MIQYIADSYVEDYTGNVVSPKQEDVPTVKTAAGNTKKDAMAKGVIEAKGLIMSDIGEPNLKSSFSLDRPLCDKAEKLGKCSVKLIPTCSVISPTLTVMSVIETNWWKNKKNLSTSIFIETSTLPY